jgi:hypothetical protein
MLGIRFNSHRLVNGPPSCGLHSTLPTVGGFNCPAETCSAPCPLQVNLA